MARSDQGTPERSARLSVQKFMREACPQCGTPRNVINGGWLRLQRERAGITLRDMAKRLNFSAPYISDVELNRRRCSPKILAAYEGLNGGHHHG